MKLKKLLKISDKLGITLYHHEGPNDIRFTANDEVFASMNKVSDKIWVGHLYPDNTYTLDTVFNGNFKKILKKCLKYSINQVTPQIKLCDPLRKTIRPDTNKEQRNVD